MIIAKSSAYPISSIGSIRIQLVVSAAANSQRVEENPVNEILPKCQIVGTGHITANGKSIFEYIAGDRQHFPYQLWGNVCSDQYSIARREDVKCVARDARS